MENSIFQIVPLKEQSLFQKIFRQYPEENSIIELNNLLATRVLKEIDIQDISDLSKKHGVNLNKIYLSNLEEFYAVYLNHCLIDKVLSDEEIEELKHLKEILGLPDIVIDQIHNEVAGLVFQKSFEEVIQDGRLDKKELKFIEKLQSDLKLPGNIAKKITDEARGKFVKDFLAKATFDQLLSPEEEMEFNAISKSLNVNTDKKTKDHLEKLKLFWIIENGELPIHEVDVKFSKNEVCYYSSYADWYETRRGNLTIIDSGSLYLTNKKVLFMGRLKNSNIGLEKILSCSASLDGVKIDKDKGKTPVLKTNADNEILLRILKRLLR